MDKLQTLKLGSDGKSKMSFRIWRADKQKWETPGLGWNVKQLLRELKIQFLNLFRTAKRYATVLTQVGEEFIVDKIDEVVQTTGDYIGWGTGTGTAAKADTALFVESAETRATASRTQPLADKIRWVGTITSASAQTITNAGNFTAVTAGTLIVHGDFTGVVLAIGDKIELTIDIEIS